MTALIDVVIVAAWLGGSLLALDLAEFAGVTVPRTCAGCGHDIPPGKVGRYCSEACAADEDGHR